MEFPIWCSSQIWGWKRNAHIRATYLNLLHVAISEFFFMDLRYAPYITLEWSGIFPSLEFQLVIIFQNRFIYKLVAGSPRALSLVTWQN